MILITGATGAFGTATIDHLLNSGVNPDEIIALVRSLEKGISLKEKGIALRVGDYNDYESLKAAFAGVDKLLFVSGSDIENRMAQHENVVKAAKEAGVTHTIYTSFVRVEGIEQSAIPFIGEVHKQTEELIKASGMTYTFLQNAIYLDMLPMFMGEQVIETGVIMQPAQTGKANWVLRSELAEAAAKVLTGEGHGNKIYPLTNTTSLTYGEVASELTAILEKHISYQSPSPEEYEAALKQYGVPEAYISLFTAFSLAQAQGELDFSDAALETLIGRKPTTVKEFLKQVYAVEPV
jgi:NAD(P)H dehydrogenase (quinone)